MIINLVGKNIIPTSHQNVDRMMKMPPKCIIDNHHIKEYIPLLAEGFPVRSNES